MTEYNTQDKISCFLKEDETTLASSFSSSLTLSETDYDDIPTTQPSKHNQLLAMISNFSTSYNVINISLVLPLTYNIYNPAEKEMYESLCTSTLLGGMIVGQIVGGALGDVIGRLPALYIMMILQIVSSTGSSLNYFSNDDFYIVLCIWRFLLGVGCGGIYPLAAVLSAESSNLEKEEKWKRMACTFSTQGFGFWSAALVSWICVLVFGEESDVGWRIILGLGCVPGLLIVMLKCYSFLKQRLSFCESLQMPLLQSNDSIEQCNEATKPSLYNAIRHEPNIARKLVGTAGIWFLFDILFYGNTLFEPLVLSSALGNSDDLSNVCRDSFILSSIALPGYIVGAYLIGSSKYQRPKYIQCRGFIIMSILYSIIGLGWNYWKQQNTLLLLLYGSTFFFANYGPNMTTFLLPSITYNEACRSTLNGISAAAGKLGAFVGSVVFVPLSDIWDDDLIMLFCAVLAFVSFGLTVLCVGDVEEVVHEPIGDEEEFIEEDEDFVIR